jgi:hypothetical protein
MSRVIDTSIVGRPRQRPTLNIISRLEVGVLHDQVVNVIAPFTMTLFHDDAQDVTVVRINADCRSWLSEHLDVKFSDSYMTAVSASYLVSTVVNKVLEGATSLQEFLVPKLGPYPYARFWMMNHLNNTGPLLASNEIPGWCWVKFRNAHPNKKCLKDEWGVADTKTKGANMPPRTVSRPQRKATTVRPQPPAGKAPKKPKCPIHADLEMKFSVIRNVWECPNEFCAQIAIPKRERVEGNVLIGKGEVSLRLVYPEKGEDLHVVLITDDNVAIDITEYVDVDEIEEKYAIDEKVESALSDGVPEATVQRIRFSASFKNATIMGVENAPE